MKRTYRRSLVVVVMMVTLVTILTAACGGSSSSPSAPTTTTPARTPIATTTFSFGPATADKPDGPGGVSFPTVASGVLEIKITTTADAKFVYQFSMQAGGGTTPFGEKGEFSTKAGVESTVLIPIPSPTNDLLWWGVSNIVVHGHADVYAQ